MGLTAPTSLFECITVQSTVGYGDIRPYTALETVYNVLVVWAGATFFAAIIGSFQALFRHLDEASGGGAFQLKMKRVGMYVTERN